MAAEEHKSGDFYSVLGLKKECTEAELKTAYKKLALRWHPDRCSASGKSKYVEEAKKKFQAIQEAYSVLSNANKRFMYDVEVYECDDDENGMGDFLSEMGAMMSQNKSSENGKESFEELKALFEEMFQSDIEGVGSSSQSGSSSSCSSSSMFATYGESSIASHKRKFDMKSGKSETENSSSFDTHFQGFCYGDGHLESYREGAGGRVQGEGKSRSSRKKVVLSGHDVSSGDNAGISA